MDLLAYLAHVKKIFNEKGLESRKVRIILGNPTCDLDSAVCSVIYGFYLHQTKANEDKTLFAPVLNISRNDYALRTEVTHAFKKYGVLREHLLFEEDLNMGLLTASPSVTLVDHHVLSETLMVLQPCVVEVIDHHQQAMEFGTHIPVTLELVGSCATLIAEKMLSDQQYHMTEDIAWLLYATIIVDTLCLSEQAGRKTVKDENMVDQLEVYLSASNREVCFKELFTAKEDVSELSNNDLLRKDLKTIQSSRRSIAMSSVLMNLRVFLQRSGVEEDLKQFSGQQGVQVVVLMTLNLTSTGDAQRQIAVYSQNAALKDEITSVLVTSGAPDLQLTPISQPLTNLSAFDQANIPASRKKVLPLLQAAIDG